MDDFLTRVGLPAASTPGFDYPKCSTALSEWLKGQVIPPDGASWVASSLGYFLGAYFIALHKGRWIVNETPGSIFFGRYVVADFPSANHPSSMVDPLQMAADYVVTPVGRDLLSLIKSTETELVYKRN
jgi:hypothetical protein